VHDVYSFSQYRCRPSGSHLFGLSIKTEGDTLASSENSNPSIEEETLPSAMCRVGNKPRSTNQLPSSHLIWGAAPSPLALEVTAFVKSGCVSLTSQNSCWITLTPAPLVPPECSKRAVSRALPVCPTAKQKVMQARCPAQSRGALDELVGIATQFNGTAILLDAPLMSAGLDSIRATEL